jgi:hypothetical protein
MDDKVFEILTRYFWAVAIAFTFVNAMIFKARSEKRINNNPQLAPGYAALYRGYLFWMNLPWVVMGIGCTVGGIPSTFAFFRPRDGNPYVLAWFATIFFIYLFGSFWIFFMRGAEVLAKHPGIFNHDISSPWLIKLLWLVSIAGGTFAAVMMWTQDIPVPKL